MFLVDNTPVGISFEERLLKGEENDFGLCSSQENLDNAVEILSETSFSSGDKQMITEKKRQLIQLLRVDFKYHSTNSIDNTENEGEQSTKVKKSKGGKKDELDSYMSLVREVGY